MEMRMKKVLAPALAFTALSFNLAFSQPAGPAAPPKPPGLYNGYTTTVLTDGRLLVAGGFTGNNILSNSVLYNPLTGKWTNSGVMSIRRYWHQATPLSDGKVM